MARPSQQRGGRAFRVYGGCGLARKIPLSGKKGAGLYALVDDADYESLVRQRWRLHRRRHGSEVWDYTSTGSRRSGTNYLMHRMLMGAEAGQTVDHINGDGLDNRRSNLRFATQLEQMRNRRPNRQHKGCKPASRFKGVEAEPDSVGHPWRARIRVNGKRINLGWHPTEVSAARAYNAAALEHFGEFARLNAA